MFSKLLSITLLTATTLACGSCAPTTAPLTRQKTTDEERSTYSKEGINWQPCTQLSFAKWFPSYVASDSLECATIEVPLQQALETQRRNFEQSQNLVEHLTRENKLMSSELVTSLNKNEQLTLKHEQHTKYSYLYIITVVS